MASHRRFDRAARLLGDACLARLAKSTVTVFGVGGVGSFAAEALVRTGVGRVILVDYDRICVTNINRQLHAMKGTLGKPKVDVMAERLRLINPDAVIEARAGILRRPRRRRGCSCRSPTSRSTRSTTSPRRCT